MAGVNSRFAEVTENDILRMQDITIPSNTKKATKLEMKVFRDKQFAHLSSVFCPDRQARLMPLSLNNNSLSTAPFQSPIQRRYLSLKWLWFPTLQQQAHGMISRGNFTNCYFNFYFK